MLTSGFLDPENTSRAELSGPLYVIVFGACGCLLLTCVLGYILNLCKGKRGTSAIPFFDYMFSWFSMSDYTLKPNPKPANEEM